MKVAHSGGILSQEKVNRVSLFIDSSEPLNLQIQSQEDKGSYSILCFKDHPSISDVEKYVGQIVYLHKESFPKKDLGEFFIFELVGLVPRSSGSLLKEFKVLKVIENPAHPILCFSNGTQEILVPFVNRFVGDVNIQEGWIEVLDWEDWFIDSV